MDNNMINYSAKEINELLDWISYNHLLFGDELNEAFQKEFNALLEKVYEKAPETVVYNTEDEMKIKLAELAKEDYKIGDVVFIVDNNVPDYWIVDVADEQNQEGYYGYFKVSPLEAKTNLNEYYSKEDVDDLIKKAIESRIWDVLNTTNKTVAGAINELKEQKANNTEVNSKLEEINGINEFQQTEINGLKQSVGIINSTLNDNPESGANGVVSNVELLLATTDSLNQNLSSANQTISDQGQEITNIKAKDESQDSLINTLSQQLEGTTEIANTAQSGVNSLGETIENVYAKQADVYKKTETYNKGEVDKKITDAVTDGTVSLDGYCTIEQAKEFDNETYNKAISHVENNLLSQKQDALVSGTNIKTINGESILGEGDLTIKVGGITVDSVFDETSTNPVEAQAIEKHINDKLSSINETLNSKANSADLANKQDILESGTNIKTINGESILGAGDITIGSNGETVSTMTGATSTLPGTSGLVPTPTAGSNTKFLRGDATWAEIPSDDSKQDKLNFDSEPTENSENSLKSGAIYSAIEAIKALMPTFVLEEDVLTIIDNTEE